MHNVLVDAERTYQVLSNVIAKAVELTKRNAQILIDGWTEAKGCDYQLFFSVASIGNTLSEQERVAILEGDWTAKGNSESRHK